MHVVLAILFTAWFWWLCARQFGAPRVVRVIPGLWILGVIQCAIGCLPAWSAIAGAMIGFWPWAWGVGAFAGLVIGGGIAMMIQTHVGRGILIGLTATLSVIAIGCLARSSAPFTSPGDRVALFSAIGQALFGMGLVVFIHTGKRVTPEPDRVHEGPGFAIPVRPDDYEGRR